MYQSRSPWFWPLFRLPFGGTLEVSVDGISFPDARRHRPWRDGDSLDLKRGLLGRIQLISADGSKRRTIGLTWPWKSAEVARELKKFREAGLHLLLMDLEDDLRAAGHAITSTLGARYVPRRLVESWLAIIPTARPLIPRLDAEWVPPELRPHLAAVAKLAAEGQSLIDAANAAFLSSEKPRLASLPQYSALTSEQLEAVITLEDATLVVASAGSGKTRVIESRVRYLVEECAVPQDRILVLAFNRAVAAEVGSRLEADGLPRVAVKTFHAMGLKIRSDVEGRNVGLSPLADPESPAPLVSLVQGVLTEALGDPTNSDVSAFLTSYLQPPAFEGDLDERDPADRKAHEEAMLAPLGMQGKRVKSYGEFLIATFLYTHQVPFEYERQYPHSAGRHRPDFTLSPSLEPHPVHYIEYFGIDRGGRTRADLDPERYVGSKTWKEVEHQRFGTKMLALHYYDLKERGVDGFNALLAEMLRDAGYALTPRAREELALELESTRLKTLVALIVNFLRLYKGSTLSLDRLRSVAESQQGRRVDRDRAQLFLRIFARVLAAYEHQLASHGETDFEDMIGRSASAVASGAWRSPFTHVLVDEFQDISPLRAHFVHAFQVAESRATIFAVGDDFQSIYRFAGSQIRIMTDFGHYFGHHRQLPLSLTHRFPAPLADASTRFVLTNPRQIRKTVRGRPSDLARPITLIRTDATASTAGLARAIAIAEGEARPEGGRTSVLLLGRYRNDAPASLERLQRTHPGLAIAFSTIHRAKGAEADVMILLNLKGGTRGFPAGVQDDPLLQLILGETDDFPEAEERRLLYVALTRARRRAIIVANDGPDSVFTRELSGPEYGSWVEVVDLRKESQFAACPRCRNGRVVPRAGPTGAFVGCTNFPHCLFTGRF